MTTHEVYTFDAEDPEDTRHYFECSCGRGGSVSAGADVDIAADKHIPEGEHRVDVNKPRY